MGYNIRGVHHDKIRSGCWGLKGDYMDKIKRMIEIDDEDILNLKSAIEKLLSISEPYNDLEILTLKSIIDCWEKNNPYKVRWKYEGKAEHEERGWQPK